MKMRYILGAVILIPVLLHVVWAFYASPTMNYYITVDQYVARSANTPIRVGGQIVPGSIKYDNATRTMRFQITGDNSKIDVQYRGIVPDAFRDGVTTILEGARTNDGGFLANTVMIKCPHQYLPAS